MTGVMAALLARAGLRGAPTIYDLPTANKKPLEAFGKKWEILGIYFKPYSTCRVAHVAIDGILKTVKTQHLLANHISKMTIGCSSQKSLNMLNYRPTNIWQAQYSIPFVIGSVLVDGEVGPKQIAENRLGDQLILQNADKVMLVRDSEVDALLPDDFAARIEVETMNSRKFWVFKRYPRGESENPLSEEELAEKFKKLVPGVVGAEKVEELAMDFEGLEKLNSIHALAEKIRYNFAH